MIHLGALGAVLRATALLPGIRAKYPGAMITWVTDPPGESLLRLSSIDRVLTTRSEDLLSLSALEFDCAFVIDKSLRAAGVLAQTKAKEVRGFLVNAMTGAVLPATPSAQRLWELGLSNHEKFFVNKKSEIQLLYEALELGPWNQSPYQVELSAEELELSRRRRQEWNTGAGPVLGLNVGCSSVIPYKKWTPEFSRSVLVDARALGFENLVLLGGREDIELARAIAKDLDVEVSPMDKGLRDGLVSVSAVDLLLTGDSLGMHMGIALERYVMAWFGPTCAHEIEFFGNGEALLSNVPCSPCWKRSCSRPVMCYDQVDRSDIVAALARGVQWWQKKNPSLWFKPPFLATSSLASPSLGG